MARYELDIEDDVNKWNKLCEEFHTLVGDTKLRIYNTLMKLESKWYPEEYIKNKPKLTDNEIIQMKNIDGTLSYVKFIYPSGDRYSVSQTTESTDLNGFSFRGGYKTRKNRE